MVRLDFVTSLGDVCSLEGEPLMLGQIKALHVGEAIVVGYEGGSWKAETRLGDRGGEKLGPRWGKEERRKGEMQEVVRWARRSGEHVDGTEDSSLEGLYGVLGEDGEGTDFEVKLEGWSLVSTDDGLGDVVSRSSSLDKVGRSPRANTCSCQGSPELA